MNIDIIYKDMPNKVKLIAYQNSDSSNTIVINKKFKLDDYEDELIQKIMYIKEESSKHL